MAVHPTRMRMRNAQQRPSSYAARTYASPHWLVRFPHQRRYAQAAEIVESLGVKSLLDYGTGDGHLLTTLLKSPAGRRLQSVVAYEPLERPREWLDDNLQVSGLRNAVRVVSNEAELASEQAELVTCLGVLEHIGLRERFRFYQVAKNIVGVDGRVLIDVPIEIGPTLAVKILGRRFLKADPSEYSWREALGAIAGRTVFDRNRFDPQATGSFNSHKGFDYRLLLKELSGSFDLQAVWRTPFSALPAALGNQEVFALARSHPD